MAIRFIVTDPETGGGYNIDDESGDVYDTSGNQLDPSTALTDPEQTALDLENQSDAETQRLENMADNPAVNGLGNISPGSSVSDGDTSSTWTQIAKTLGIIDSKGNYDFKKILGLAGTGIGLIDAATSSPQTQKSISELRAGMPATNTPTPWTEEQLAFGRRPMQTGSALQRVYAADMQSPVTPGKTSKQYAHGGEVQGALTQAFEGAVQGLDGGQSDMIDAKLSPGEYVFDAESVSALGDGNTEAGVAKLDELRRQLREQKRSAPVDDIPSQSRGPLSYMQGA